MLLLGGDRLVRGQLGTDVLQHAVQDRAWLSVQPIQPAALTELQTLLDAFREEYNQRRPHRSLEHPSTPAAAYLARPKVTPSKDRSRETHHRVRTDKIAHVGTVTLRHNGRLHHTGVGRTYAGTYVRMLVHDLDSTIVDAPTGQILRELVLDPAKDYQGTGRPPGPAPKRNNNGPTSP
ncbi:integrase core domain-containing protein [Cellulomonas sp. HD19AZ1]|uniref:integrase core domain-containing protein n=1 Tax=Cellulomonas sp. HD19AZ1 TaxID=2559593 RepID=UPI001071412C|nr:integrase core domain-containing protein [Cellulomonas sp. HD19AZ1]TFH69431.1 hypothetical protein E4A51_15335 [Cellulomonas sp. HD19AZ1]